MGGAVHIETRLCEDLWTALVDPTQIELVILNLAINARDALEVGSGGVVVETSNVTVPDAPSRPEEPEPGAYVAVAVHDRGCGMSEEVRAKAFEPFFTTKEVGKGTGLGLSQVLGFAKQSGGGVRIDSAPGQGTTVWVFLPRAEREAPLEHLPAGYDRSAVKVADITVLLVDDDADVREVTAAMLRESGLCRAGGRQRRRRAGGARQAAGGSAARRLRHAGHERLGGRARGADPPSRPARALRHRLCRHRGHPSGREDRIIAKPFQFEQLLQTIDQVLGAEPGATSIARSH